jgi:arylsulfatase A-like enzyme
MPRVVAIAVFTAALLLTHASASAQTTKPATTESSASTPDALPPSSLPRPRVLIISIDGLRPDLLLRAKTPYIHELFEAGSYSFWARTVPHAITLPSHVSMLTGVAPRKHGIEWNVDLPLTKPVYPKFLTLFGVAKKAGYTTAMAAGKMKFGALLEPGTVDWQYVPDSEKSDDADVAARAIQIIASHRPQVMAVHLPGVDNVGHAIGWGTPQQLAAIEQADAHVGSILAALRAANLRESTYVILTADHGGAGRTHMADDARARHIPWIINGPGIRKGLDLTTFEPLTINTEDTFATACRLLNLRIDGKPVMAVFEQPVELLTTTGE